MIGWLLGASIPLLVLSIGWEILLGGPVTRICGLDLPEPTDLLWVPASKNGTWRHPCGLVLGPWSSYYLKLNDEVLGLSSLRACRYQTLVCRAQQQRAIDERTIKALLESS